MDDKPYNIFKELKLTRKELFHSAMITVIVSHKDDTNSRNLFFNMLKNSLNNNINNGIVKNPDLFVSGINNLVSSESIDWNNSNHLWIDNEVYLVEKFENNIGEIIERERGRADIWIGSNKYYKGVLPYRLIIENKIDAPFQSYQLRNYYRYLTSETQRQFGGLFVLCLKNRVEETKKHIEETFPSESNNKIDDKTNCAIITYDDDIIQWLQDVEKEAQGNFKLAVNDYLDIVKSL